MMWNSCTLYQNIANGEDELGNEITEPKEIWTGSARFTPWTLAQIGTLGRTVTDVEQLFALPAVWDDIKDADQADMDGVMYTITEKSRISSRWCLIQVKAYKQ